MNDLLFGGGVWFIYSQNVDCPHRRCYRIEISKLKVKKVKTWGALWPAWRNMTPLSFFNSAIEVLCFLPFVALGFTVLGCLSVEKERSPVGASRNDQQLISGHAILLCFVAPRPAAAKKSCQTLHTVWRPLVSGLANAKSTCVKLCPRRRSSLNRCPSSKSRKNSSKSSACGNVTASSRPYIFHKTRR